MSDYPKTTLDHWAEVRKPYDDFLYWLIRRVLTPIADTALRFVLWVRGER